MYFPIGWPKKADFSLINNEIIHQICFDRVKILLAVITDTILGIWYGKPLIPIVYHRRYKDDELAFGVNTSIIWKPDSSMIAVTTDKGNIILYALEVTPTLNGVFNQVDSPLLNLRRDSAELFVKEIIPSLSLNLVYVIPLSIPITAVTCVSLTQIMIATKTSKIFRINWDGQEDENFTIDLQKIPYKTNHPETDYGIAVLEVNAYTISLDYSPLLGGFAITFNNGRAAFLTALNLKFNPNEIQCLWASNLDDATCCSVNHKFRLLAFGRKNSQAVVYTIDDTTGGLELSHKLALSSKDFPGLPGAVNNMKWTPDGCAVIMSWENGGFSLWSTFGTMLMCSLGWDYGLNVDLSRFNPLQIIGMEWSIDGYQLFMLRKQQISNNDENSSNNNNNNNNKESASSSVSITNNFEIHVLIMDFVKSTLTLNPCMAANFHILLQGDDKLYVNQGKNLEKIYFNSKYTFPNSQEAGNLSCSNTNVSLFNSDDNMEVGKSMNFTSMLSESKQWIIVSLPLAYISTNWPIRYTAIDASGVHLAVAGRTGLAHYSMYTKKWRLFGNETQEKDFVVTGGLLWWNDFIVAGCFNLIERTDELRIYPKAYKLDNRYSRKLKIKTEVILLNSYKDQLIVLTADGKVTVFQLTEVNNSYVEMEFSYEIDIRGVCTHPACVVSITMTHVNNDSSVKLKKPTGNIGICGGSGSITTNPETLILNVSGRLLMIQRETNTNNFSPTFFTCLASCVECIWLSTSTKSHIKDSLWLYSGAHGMRVWLPVLPCNGDITRNYRHTFMSKRIMLSFSLKLYPLVILFEDVIVLGVENEAILYTNDSNLHFSLPFSILQKKSQVYLHQILRQLIRRNLGYNAWEIARSCSNLPYFPHSLELLLHEVLEDEATSKEPIPDALLPSVLEFIKEFPVYLQTIVQCARKTEIALWPYLFASAGKPKELFQQCISVKNLETAASYLIILQNLEPSAISRQYATLLLDTALECKKWDLAKDLVRFLKAIDPNDVDSPRTSLIINNKFMSSQPSQQVNPNPEDLSLILGSITRGRSFSTSMTPQNPAFHSNQQIEKNSLQNLDANNLSHQQQQSQHQQQKQRKKSVPGSVKEKHHHSSSSASTSEKFFIEEILQRHGRRLLKEKKLRDLGYMSAFLDFHLVSWLIHEDDEALRINDFVGVLNHLHTDLNWPMPNLSLPPPTNFEFNASRSKLNVVDSGYSSLPFSNKDGMTSDCALARTLHCMLEERKEMNTNAIAINENRNDNINGNGQQDSTSICSDEISSVIGDEISLTAIRNTQNNKINHAPQKLEVQIRYLLQIFTEANWLDYSLVLSILLLDAASISRITDTAIRSSSLIASRQLRNALKEITRWSFNEGFGYRAFMLKLQPQISALDQYVIRQESMIANKSTTDEYFDTGKMIGNTNVSGNNGGGGGISSGSGGKKDTLSHSSKRSVSNESHHSNSIRKEKLLTNSNSGRHLHHHHHLHNHHHQQLAKLPEELPINENDLIQNEDSNSICSIM